MFHVYRQPMLNGQITCSIDTVILPFPRLTAPLLIGKIWFDRCCVSSTHQKTEQVRSYPLNQRGYTHYTKTHSPDYNNLTSMSLDV